MNHLRRGVGAIVVLSACLGVALVACDTAREGLGSASAPSVEYRTDRWTDLPPSPVGDWSRYNWVWLADGSGFVHAGAAQGGNGGTVDSTEKAAWFSFEAGRYNTLPDLPVQSGMGQAGGSWVGHTLVLVGQDCPPMPGASFSGVEFCGNGGMGTKVVLTLERGGTVWTEHPVPEWMEEFRWGSPEVLGVQDGRLLVASGHEPAHIGAFDPATGEWTRLPDAPTHRPDGAPGPGIDAATSSFSDELAARPCLVGTTLFATIVEPNPSLLSFSTGAADVPPDVVTRWYRLEGDAFVDMPAPITGAVASIACMRDGFYVSRTIRGGLGEVDLSWVDPLAGTVELLDDNAHSGIGVFPSQQFGDVALIAPPLFRNPGPVTAGAPAPPVDGDDVDPFRTYRVATPTGMVDTDLERAATAEAIVGPYVVESNDDAGQRDSNERTDPPRIARLGVGR